MPRSGPILAGFVSAALVLLAAPATAAPAVIKVRYKAPTSATAGARFPVVLTGTRGARVRLYIVRRTRPRQALADVRPRRGARAAAAPILRGSAITVRVRAPTRTGRYALMACLRPRTRCTPPTSLRIVAAVTPPPFVGPPGETVPAPVAPPVIVPVPVPTPESVPARRAPNPLAVTLTPDTTRRVSREIGPAGGELTVISAGVQYTLTIPAGALAGNETVALTPAAVAGLPFGGGVTGAVTLEPDGLTLLKQADLAITGSAAPAPGSSAAFGADADGSEMHLAPVSVDGRTLHLALRHFSVAGAGVATEQDVRDVLAAAPTGEEELAVGDLAGAQALFARGELDAAGLAAAGQAALRRWRLAEVEPELLRAETDDAGFEAATAGFLAWQDAVQTSGFDLASDLARLTGSHQRAVAFGFQRGFDRCLSGGGFEQMGRLMLLRHLQQSLGYGAALDDERLVRCGRFKLARQVTTALGFPAYTVPGDYEADAGGWSYRLDAGGLPIVYEPGDIELRGSGTQVASQWEYAASRHSLDADCDQHVATTGIGPPSTGALTLLLELPVDLRRQAVERRAVVRVATQGPIALRYEIVRTRDGLPCGSTTRTALDVPGPGATVRVPVAAGQTGRAFAETVVSIPGAPASETTRADVTVTLHHTPCPVSTPLASCP